MTLTNHHRLRAVHVIVILCALSNGSSVEAGIVHFINPPPGEEGHYDWHWEWGSFWEIWLDVTLAPESQVNEQTGSSVAQISTVTSFQRNHSQNGAAVATVRNEFDVPFTQALSAGDNIDGGLEFLASRVIHAVSDDPRDIESEFDEGVLAYIGVRTTSGNYGWIAVQRGVGTFPENHSLAALAWAYQTEPGIPIRAGEVPAVGGVALFGLAGLGARRRRMR
jgi:hypothetical protein